MKTHFILYPLHYRARFLRIFMCWSVYVWPSSHSYLYMSLFVYMAQNPFTRIIVQRIHLALNINPRDLPRDSPRVMDHIRQTMFVVGTHCTYFYTIFRLFNRTRGGPLQRVILLHKCTRLLFAAKNLSSKTQFRTTTKRDWGVAAIALVRGTNALRLLHIMMAMLELKISDANTTHVHSAWKRIS